MAKYAEESKTIEEAFEIILYACENIKDYEQCHNCPLRYMCLEDSETSVLDLGDLISKDSWAEFLEYSEAATLSEGALYAQHIDNLRDMKKDEALERWYDENDG